MGIETGSILQLYTPIRLFKSLGGTPPTLYVSGTFRDGNWDFSRNVVELFKSDRKFQIVSFNLTTVVAISVDRPTLFGN